MTAEGEGRIQWWQASKDTSIRTRACVYVLLPCLCIKIKSTVNSDPKRKVALHAKEAPHSPSPLQRPAMPFASQQLYYLTVHIHSHAHYAEGLSNMTYASRFLCSSRSDKDLPTRQELSPKIATSRAATRLFILPDLIQKPFALAIR